MGTCKNCGCYIPDSSGYDEADQYCENCQKQMMRTTGKFTAVSSDIFHAYDFDQKPFSEWQFAISPIINRMIYQSPKTGLNLLCVHSLEETRKDIKEGDHPFLNEERVNLMVLLFTMIGPIMIAIGIYMLLKVEVRGDIYCMIGFGVVWSIFCVPIYYYMGRNNYIALSESGVISCFSGKKYIENKALKFDVNDENVSVRIEEKAVSLTSCDYIVVIEDDKKKFSWTCIRNLEKARYYKDLIQYYIGVFRGK